VLSVKNEVWGERVVVMKLDSYVASEPLLMLTPGNRTRAPIVSPATTSHCMPAPNTRAQSSPFTRRVLETWPGLPPVVTRPDRVPAELKLVSATPKDAPRRRERSETGARPPLPGTASC